MVAGRAPPHRQGPARALTAESGVRAQLVRPLGRTGSAVLVSDAGGEQALEVHPLTGRGEVRRLAAGALGQVLHLEADAAGERVAALGDPGPRTRRAQGGGGQPARVRDAAA